MIEPPFDDYLRMTTAARCADHADALEPDPSCPKCVALVFGALDVVDDLYATSTPEIPNPPLEGTE